MYYDFAVTVTAGKTKNTPKEQTLKLTKGVIHYVEVNFPAGCRGYAFMTLRHQEHQVWPTNPERAFSGEGYTIPMQEYYKLYSEPYSLKAVAWSPDATYDHTITVRIGILSEEELEPVKETTNLLQKFLKLLGGK